MSTVIDASTEAGSGVPASPPRENLIRASRGIDLVRADGEAMPTLAGHFAVFNEWTEINSIFEGNFMERFAPGAFSKTIRESRDQMRVLFQHGQDPTVGDKVLGPIKRLAEDETGAAYEVPMLDTTYNRDLIPGLEAGLYGASFRFRVMKEEFVAKPKRSKSNPGGLPERTVTEAQVREFGPVTFPAYPGATAGLRSLTDEFMLARFAQDPERLAEVAQRAGVSFRTVEPLAYTATTSSGGEITITFSQPETRAAATPAEEPAPSEDATPDETREEPEPSAATTRAPQQRQPAPLFTTDREEEPTWLL